MATNLCEAVMADLANFTLKNENELQIYCRYLFEVAYFKKDVDLETARYAKQKSNIIEEIQSLTYNGDKYLNYDQLIDSVVNSFFLEHKDKMQLITNTEMSFSGAIKKMISYYQKDCDLSSIDEVIKLVDLILDNYFYKNNINVFSSKNGTREYIKSKNRDFLVCEMKNSLNTDINDFDSIKHLFLKKVAYSWYNENIKSVIESNITKLNLNNSQKQWLLDEFTKGNIASLERFIDNDLLNRFVSSCVKDESSALKK